MCVGGSVDLYLTLHHTHAHTHTQSWMGSQFVLGLSWKSWMFLRVLRERWQPKAADEIKLKAREPERVLEQPLAEDFSASCMCECR